MAKRVLIVAGEASGDLYGASLARELRAIHPPLHIFGMGGDRMRGEGVDLLFHIKDLSVVGITEVILKFHRILQAYRGLKKTLWEERPDVLVLIDFPDFNLYLARTAKKTGVPVLYYISPQVWAWRPGRIRTIRRLVRKMLVILPFEEKIYREARVEVNFIGHPLLDWVPSLDRERVRQELGLGEGDTVIGLLPGSREEEVKRHLPLMLQSAKIILQDIPGIRFLLAKADSLKSNYIEERLALEFLPVRVLKGLTYEVMRASDLLLVASGTATLEAALLEVPMVIVYRVSLLSWFLGRMMIRVPYVGLVNLVAGEELIPELIQFQATPERVSRVALAILSDPEGLDRIRKGLSSLRTGLGSPGASRRAALEALEMMGIQKGNPEDN